MIKYIFQENIFSSINTAEKAYWIGFLYADGSIAEKGNSIYLSLKEDDKDHLLAFEKFLNMSESCLRYDKVNKAWRFTITREQTYQDLIKIGFTSTKSYDKESTVWDNIPEQYKKDFLLGLWDGDGSFTISSTKRQIASLISNNDTLIKIIVQYINSNLGEDFCKVKERTEGDPYPRIRITCNKAKLFGDWLYKDITYPVLNRKYENYKNFHIGSRAQFGWNNAKTKGILCIDSGEIYATAKECCLAEFGIDNPGAINNIRTVCRGERAQTRGKHFRYLTDKEKEEYLNGEFNI